MSFVFEGIGDDERIGDFGIMGGGAAGAEIDRFDTVARVTARSLAAGFLGRTFGRLPADFRGDLRDTARDSAGPQDPDVRADLVYFTLEGGGAVFSTGSIAWTGSLSHNGYDNNVSRITGNVLRRFLDEEPLG